MKDLDRLLNITENCRDDMHEPDEQGVTASVIGDHLDNAYGTQITVENGFQEYIVILKRDGKQELFNLANLIALARDAGAGSADLQQPRVDVDLPALKLAFRKYCEEEMGEETLDEQFVQGGYLFADFAIEQGHLNMCEWRGEEALRAILGNALKKSEFLEIYVNGRVGKLRDGSPSVVAAYEDAEQFYNNLLSANWLPKPPTQEEA